MNEYFEIIDFEYVSLDYSKIISLNKNKTINDRDYVFRDLIKNLIRKVFDIIS
jgi:hypothetical protein